MRTAPGISIRVPVQCVVRAPAEGPVVAGKPIELKLDTLLKFMLVYFVLFAHKHQSEEIIKTRLI